MTEDKATSAGSEQSGQWIWDRDNDRYRPLARFASVTALRELGLHDREAYQKLAAMTARPGSDTTAAVHSVTERLYERLRGRGYPYAAPWAYHNGKQQIRDPVVIHQDAGTCLDLSLLFAAMLAAVGLRPFVVILEGRYDGGHALVLVDLASTPPGIGQGRSGREAPVLPEEFSGEVGVRQLVPGPEPVSLTEYGLAVEVLAACGEPNAAFDEACRAGAARLTDRRYRKVHLVDVLACHERDGDAPLPSHRPAIYPSLPSMPPFVGYRSREKMAKELRGAAGTVVLLGEPGTGKSMLAHHVASTVDHGCGWFLDASTEESLTIALAEQEARAKGLSAGSVDGEESAVLARAALARLQNSAGPWAVVLDNANQSPGSLKSLPRPAAERGQLLIITTTNPKWDDGRHEVAPLPALSLAEVTAAINAPEVPVNAIAGRPLLVHASLRFHAATGRWWWTGRPTTAESAPAVFWAAVAAELTGDDRAREVAWAISWLPPVRIAVAALLPAGAGETRPAVCRLQDLGLIDAEANEVTMHRLFRGAARESALRENSRAQATLVSRLLQDGHARKVMEFAADLTTARDIGRLLGASPDARMAVAGLYELGRVFERHGTSADSAVWYAEFTQRAGWTPGSDVPEDLRLDVANALVGMARAVGRGLTGEDGQALPSLNEAIPWTADAERLCRGRLDAVWRQAATHAKATRGFLLRKRASLEPDGSATKLDFLLQAEAILRESYRERLEQFKDQAISPALDRSQFNLAGLEIRLAQTDQPSSAAAHLDEAWRHYTEVLETRRRRYRTDDLEEVVCCLHGQAIVLYYRAILLEGAWTDKTALLRTATGRVEEAVAIRQRIAGPVDDPNTSKSLLLQAKIALARLAVVEAAGTKANRDDVAIKAFRKERAQLLAVPGDDGSSP